VGGLKQSRQPSYIAAMASDSEVSQDRGENSPSATGNCLTRERHNRHAIDKSYRNKHCALSKNHTTQTATKHKMSDTTAKLHTRRFSDMAQWLQNGEDDTAGNYIDRRVVESVLKCRQFHKQFPEKKSGSQLATFGLNYATHIARMDGTLNSGNHEAGKLDHCRPNVADNLYQEFNRKLEAEVDDDSGFSGDRNSASSTSSGLSVESSLTSLGSVTDFWSSERSSSGAVDQSTTHPVPPLPHTPVPVPVRTSSLSNNISSICASEVVPDVEGNRLVAEQIYGSLYGSLPRRKTVEPSSRSCRQSETSSCHKQESLPLSTNPGWCSCFSFFL